MRCLAWESSRRSSFQQQFPFQRAQRAGTCFPDGPSLNLGGVQVPTLLIGDAAYPLLPWLIKPFPQTADRAKLSFNMKLSSTRMVVERAFGQLKGRFRILLKQQDTSLKNRCNVVTACCILHNFCLTEGDYPDDDWIVEDADDPENHDFDDVHHCDRQADATRAALFNYVSANN